MFEFKLNKTGANEITVELRGDLVLGKPTERFRSCLQALTDRYSAITLNAKGLHRVDSAGLGELVRSKSDAKKYGNEIRLIGAQRGVRNVLLLTKLLTVFDGTEEVAQ